MNLKGKWWKYGVEEKFSLYWGEKYNFEKKGGAKISYFRDYTIYTPVLGSSATFWIYLKCIYIVHRDIVYLRNRIRFALIAEKNDPDPLVENSDPIVASSVHRTPAQNLQ